MTTEITKSTSPRLPRPADYTPYSERILAGTRKDTTTRQFWALALAVAMGILGLIAAGFILPT